MAEVRGLGAWCELVAEAGPRLSFVVHETAELADGRVLTLHQGRGFSSSVHVVGGAQPVADWPFPSTESIRASVLTTVLPDDDEAQVEHPWPWLVRLLADQGVLVTVEELQAVPYNVGFGPVLKGRLQEAEALPGSG